MSSNSFIKKASISHYSKKAIQLLDEKIIFCSYKHVYIYNFDKCEVSFDIDIDQCFDIVQLDYEHIIISGARAVQYRYKIKNINLLILLKVKENNCEIIQHLENEDPINKLLVLSNNIIVSCSFKEIQFYNYDNKCENNILKKYLCIKPFYFTLSVNECNPKEIVVSGFEKNYFLIFYEINFNKRNFQQNFKLRVSMTYRGQTFEKINKYILIVGDIERIILINLKKHFIQQEIKCESFIRVFLKLNNNILLGGDQYGNLYKWDIINNCSLTNKKINSICNGEIYNISKYNNNGFLSCGEDSKVKIWINEDKKN